MPIRASAPSVNHHGVWHLQNPIFTRGQCGHHVLSLPASVCPSVCQSLGCQRNNSRPVYKVTWYDNRWRKITIHKAQENKCENVVGNMVAILFRSPHATLCHRIYSWQKVIIVWLAVVTYWLLCKATKWHIDQHHKTCQLYSYAYQ